MNWYPWLNATYRQLVAHYASNHGHPALLLHAASGVGCDALVYALSRWILCQHPKEGKSCGHCHACQLMLAGTHPDYHYLQAEKGKSSIGVDPVRQLINALHGHAQQGGAKVIVIDPAEQLTEAAVNALLKTVEEPPENTWFLFTTHNTSLLPATLRSRCRYYFLPQPESALALRWLEKETSASLSQRKTALALTQNAPLNAAKLLQPEYWEQRVRLGQTLLSALQQQDMLQLLSLLNHDDVAERIYWLTTLFVDALKQQVHAQGFVVNDDQNEVVFFLTRYTPATLNDVLYSWLDCRQQLMANNGINRELLLTATLLDSERHFSLL